MALLVSHLVVNWFSCNILPFFPFVNSLKCMFLHSQKSFPNIFQQIFSQQYSSHIITTIMTKFQLFFSFFLLDFTDFCKIHPILATLQQPTAETFRNFSNYGVEISL
ncbi:hypothetical protein KFK09_019548 [Dendrobium nobile]|uniref:Uncharacterized protein n=1 Tax=Dendrobium nobile TaxID=94219 RepID=A0A8T3ARE7_DENNO|nr:hypothetical protein KFK09_019548 [Dendrobium nobile]